MRSLTLSLVFIAVVGLLAGCSGGGASEEPAPKGNAPEVKQATPDMKSPEERARMQGGGGEGS